MPFYEKGKVRIHYEEAGSGFPLLLIPGGGLESKIAFFQRAPFNAIEEFKSEYRVITCDLRNAKGGQSSGPLDVDRPWDSFADDQLGVLDHLGIDKFFVMGFCIGNPMLWTLLKRAPERIVAAVSAQPSAFRPELPRHSYESGMKKWGPALCERRPDINMEMVEKFLRNLYLANPDFVFSVTRDFACNCKTPLLVMPDDTTAHPYAMAMEMVRITPNAQVCLYPWKNTPQNIALAVRHARTFLKAHRPPA